MDWVPFYVYLPLLMVFLYLSIRYWFAPERRSPFAKKHYPKVWTLTMTILLPIFLISFVYYPIWLKITLNVVDGVYFLIYLENWWNGDDGSRWKKKLAEQSEKHKKMFARFKPTITATPSPNTA